MATYRLRTGEIHLVAKSIVFRSKLVGFQLLSERCNIVRLKSRKIEIGRVLIDVAKEGGGVFLLLESSYCLPFQKDFSFYERVSFHLVGKQQAYSLLKYYCESKAVYRVDLKDVPKFLGIRRGNMK